MSAYWVKTPFWLKRLFPSGLIWDMPISNEPTVYLTFDDGPHPTATPFVLQQLAKYDARASFFCVGDNVVKYPAIFQQTLSQGHTVANHTFNHINGWQHTEESYLSNIAAAAQVIDSRNFRPPYGRIRSAHYKAMLQNDPRWKVYMWDILSGDFDNKISPEQCAANVTANIRPGSIVVFHDSDKAWERMSYALPLVLAHCAQQKWAIKPLPKN